MITGFMTYFNMYKNLIIIGSIIGLIGYHFYIKLSLESSILEKDKKILKITNENYALTIANDTNLNTIAMLEKDFKKYDEIIKIKTESKDKEILKMKEVINSLSKKIKYENTYIYEKCEIKVHTGDKNETDPILKSIINIGN